MYIYIYVFEYVYFHANLYTLFVLLKKSKIFILHIIVILYSSIVGS